MQLQYIDDPISRAIKVTLGQQERLGNYAGPVEIVVPLDPANIEYAAILEQKLKIEPVQ